MEKPRITAPDVKNYLEKRYEYSIKCSEESFISPQKFLALKNESKINREIHQTIYRRVMSRSSEYNVEI
jgi:hypothetical protein